ncbi:hypothetical protein M422DRAFT_26887 [Sphaerobolus stellatus SS14]|nr:hypothetical protein M422DRAFT_26887 [Sphaerobolus stellatus SS14]
MSFIYGSPKTPFGPPGATDEADNDSPFHKPGAHHRRMSTSWVPVRFGQQGKPPADPAQQERSAGILRRLSISTPLAARPTVTPPAKRDGGTGKPPSPKPSRTPRRASTLAPGTSKPHRAPSPMGERILKGHYDGF